MKHIRPTKHLTESRLQAVLILRRVGWKQKTIAEVLGVSENTVGSWCRKLLVAQEEERKSDIRKRNIELLSTIKGHYMEHYSYPEIANQTGLSYSQVSKSIREITTLEERKRIGEERAEKKRSKQLAVVNRWLQPGESYKTLSKRTGINRSTIHGWIHDESLPYTLRSEIQKKFASMNQRKNQSAVRLPSSRRMTKQKNSLPTDKTPAPSITSADIKLQHAYAQAALVVIGVNNGFKVWVPKSDRKAVRAIIPNAPLLEIWPWNHISEHTNRVVSNIDVIWFESTGNIINSAYEVEHSTGIHPGLGRLKDIRLCHPNLHIDCYIVAPESHRVKFERQISREIYQDAAIFLTYEEIDSGNLTLQSKK